MREKVITFLFLWILPVAVFSQEVSESDDLRTLVTLLDYVSKDYREAVEDGVVIDEAEYAEQIDFVERCISLHEELTAAVNEERFSDLRAGLDSLLSYIEQKKSPNLIAETATASKNKILDLGILKIIPDRWPSIPNGAELYQASCASCHGIDGKGGGDAGRGLDPPPTDFHDPDGMELFSPLLGYNVIKLGIEGTGMRAFNELTEDEIWDLSFYIASLRHTDFSPVKKLPGNLTLDDLSKWTDQETRTYLKHNHPDLSLESVRNFQPEKPDPLYVAMENLDLSRQAYSEGDRKKAGKLALTSYLEGIEPVEKILSPGLVRRIETDMVFYRKAIQAGSDDDVNRYYGLVKEEIQEAREELSGIDYSFAFVFGAALTILLREALEALLIILIVLRVLRPLNIRKAERALHIGWILAVIAGFLSWIFVDHLVQLSAASRELMEGIGSLIAVAVLLYAGVWLHSHAEVSKWSRFVKEKISGLSESGNWAGLGIFSFIVVFREAFEVVLFLYSLTFDDPETAGPALRWALLAAVVIIALITYVFLKTTRRLPLGKIFKVSAVIIAVLAVILAGKGIHALQEAGRVGVTPLDFVPQIDILGIFPNLQTIVGQLAVLVIILFLNRRNAGKIKSK